MLEIITILTGQPDRDQAREELRAYLAAACADDDVSVWQHRLEGRGVDPDLLQTFHDQVVLTRCKQQVFARVLQVVDATFEQMSPAAEQEPVCA